jgi:hypothetical protein
MRQTFCQRSNFPVSLSWLHAGADSLGTITSTNALTVRY